MNSRLNLQTELESIPGVKKVYFQPPATIRMVHPCIVYNRSNIDFKYADDIAYHTKKQYMITVIDPDPDSEIPDLLVEKFRMCRMDRHYTSDNLNHDVFTIYY